MTIDELIEKLQEIKKEYGNLEVNYSYNDDGYLLTGSTPVETVDIEKNHRYDKVKKEMFVRNEVVLY